MRVLLITAVAVLLVCAPAQASSLTLTPVGGTSTHLRFAARGVALDAVSGATLRLRGRKVTLTGARVRAGARAGRIVVRVRSSARERRGARLVLRLATRPAPAPTGTPKQPDPTPAPAVPTPTPTPAAPAPTPDPTPAPAPPAAEEPIPIGMHGVLRWRSGKDLTDTVDLLADAGFTVAREDIGWYRVEPSRGAPYDWGFADRMVGAAARRGIRIAAVLDDAPDWATGAWNLPPLAGEPLRAFSAFARAAVARFGSTGTFWDAHPELPRLPIRQWEIWNEPYYTFSWALPGLPDPLAYGRMFRDVAAAAASADPQAQFLLQAHTGVSQAPFPYPPYLSAMLEGVAGLAEHVDAVAIHPYVTDPVPCTPQSGNPLATIFQFCKVQDVRRILDAHGLAHAKLWITETGWSTAPAAGSTVSEAQQAVNVQTVFAALRRWRDVDGLVLYTLHDAPGAAATDREGRFGFLRADGSPKPAWAALLGEVATGVRSP